MSDEAGVFGRRNILESITTQSDDGRITKVVARIDGR
jgi:hypothetical protein